MYFRNITDNEILQYKPVMMPNFSITLTEILNDRSGLFKIIEINNEILKIIPIFNTETIESTNPEDRIIDDKVILTKKPITAEDDVYVPETVYTFKSNPDKPVTEYCTGITGKIVGDRLTVEEFNSLVWMLRQNTIHTERLRISETVSGLYGDYEFDFTGLTVLDDGFLINNPSDSIRVRLTNKVFNYSEYSLELKLHQISSVNIMDDMGASDFIKEETLTIQLDNSGEWVEIGLTDFTGFILDYDVNISIRHDRPVVQYLDGLKLDVEPAVVGIGDTTDFTATLLNQYGLPYTSLSEGTVVHFFEEIKSNSIMLNAVPDIIQVGEYSDITAKVQDEDGSGVVGATVHFYQKEEEEE